MHASLYFIFSPKLSIPRYSWVELSTSRSVSVQLATLAVGKYYHSYQIRRMWVRKGGGENRVTERIEVHTGHVLPSSKGPRVTQCVAGSYQIARLAQSVQSYLIHVVINTRTGLCTAYNTRQVQWRVRPTVALTYSSAKTDRLDESLLLSETNFKPDHRLCQLPNRLSVPDRRDRLKKINDRTWTFNMTLVTVVLRRS